MKFRFTVPSVRDALAKTEADIAASITTAMRAATDGLKGDLRQDAKAAGLGDRVARAWRGNTYPKGRNSADAASYVYSNAPKIISAFQDGAVIRSRRGRFLAIPTPAAGLQSGYGGGRKFTPSLWEAAHGVKLQFVKNKKGHCFLIARLRTRTGKVAASPGTRYAAPTRATKPAKLVTVVIFELVPQAVIGKRLDVQATADKWASRVPGLIADCWKE